MFIHLPNGYKRPVVIHRETLNEVQETLQYETSMDTYIYFFLCQQDQYVRGISEYNKISECKYPSQFCAFYILSKVNK